MIDFLIYDAKVAVLIVVFYMFYRLLLAKETFHRVNRVVLLSTALLSFALPLCVITTHQTVVLDAVPVVSVGDLRPEVLEEDSSTPLWQMVIPILYIIGVLATLGHTLLSVWKVVMLVRRSERIPQADGTTLCVVKDDVPPFSFCSYIVMNHSDYEANDAAVLAHERGHIRLHHSCDVLLVDILTALQWFNPAMWMLRADLRAIHEYEADGAVLSQGINARQYQYLLITKAASIGGYSIANGISHSTLKNRITMMLQKKSPRSSFMKLLALIPIVGVALALNAETVNDYVYQQPQKKIIKKGKKNATAKMGNNTIEIVPDTASNVRLITAKKAEEKKSVEVLHAKEVFTPLDQNPEYFDVVEQMPQFPGGPHALFEFLAKNIRYPEAAEKAGCQGRVIATFVVLKDGSVSNPKVVKSVSPELDEEALRVLNAMPNWTPGKQSGQVVNVKYTIPISFALPDSKVEETKESSVVVVGMK